MKTIDNDELICDFCSSPDITRSYPCEEFEMIEIGSIHQVSEGAWAACTPCAELIDADKWEELAVRSVDSAPFPLPAAQRIAYLLLLRNLHQRFRKARKYR